MEAHDYDAKVAGFAPFHGGQHVLIEPAKANRERGPMHRVLIFHPALAPYRIDLFNALAQRCRARVVFLDRDVTYQAYDQERLRSALAVDFDFLDRGFRVAGRTFRMGLWSEIEAFAPDVVVTHEYSATTLSVVARRAVGSIVPHIVWTADNPRVIAREQRLRRLARSVALPRLDGLLVYGEETAAHYRSEFGVTQPIGLCPNVQSESLVRRKLEEALPATRQLVDSLSLAGRKVVLFVGRLAPVKRVDRLIDAFAAAFPHQRDVVLLLVGDGPERNALELRAGQVGVADRTIFAGHVEGALLYAYFNCGSVFVLPSESEPWGAVVNEALLAGLPVVCSDRAGAKELIQGNDCGEVVDAGNDRALASALDRWVGRSESVGHAQHLRPSLMTRGFQSAVDGFCGLLEAVTRAPRRLSMDA